MKFLKCFLIVFLVAYLPDPLCAEHCSKCIVDTCQTLYPTYGDGDGDGMSDDYEMQLARRFKPTLYYGERGIRTLYLSCITETMKNL